MIFPLCDHTPAYSKPFQTPRDQAVGTGAEGLSRPMHIARVWYSLLRQAAVQNLTVLRSNVSESPSPASSFLLEQNLREISVVKRTTGAGTTIRCFRHIIPLLGNYCSDRQAQWGQDGVKRASACLEFPSRKCRVRLFLDALR